MQTINKCKAVRKHRPARTYLQARKKRFTGAIWRGIRGGRGLKVLVIYSKSIWFRIQRFLMLLWFLLKSSKRKRAFRFLRTRMLQRNLLVVMVSVANTCRRAMPGLFSLRIVLMLVLGFYPVFSSLISAHYLNYLSRSEGKNDQPLLYYSVMLLIFLSLQGVTGWLHGISSHLRQRISLLFSKEITALCLTKSAALDVSNFMDSKDLEELSQLRNEGPARISSLFEYSIDLAGSLITLVGCFLTLFLFGAWIPTLLLIACLYQLRSNIEFGHGQWVRLANSVEQNMKLRTFGDALSSYRGLRELKLNGLSGTYLNRILGIQTEKDTQVINTGFAHSIDQLRGQLLLHLVLVVVAVITFAKLLNGSMPMGTFCATLGLCFSFSYSLQSIANTLGTLSEYSRHAATFYRFLRREQKVASKSNAIPILSSSAPQISLQGVFYRYSEKRKGYALRDLSLEVAPGETCCIVGENGAGKSTLINLLCRILDPEEGRVLINGQNLKDCRLEDWQKMVGCAFQDRHQFQGITLAEYISGNPVNPDIERIMQAVDKSCFAGILNSSKVKNGLNSIIGAGFKDGISFSLGELQRLSNANLFYQNRPVLILDEPTSAMDIVSEATFMEHLAARRADQTLFLVTHKFLPIFKKAKILVLGKQVVDGQECGVLIECGSHEELLKKGGKYADWVKKQQT